MRQLEARAQEDWAKYGVAAHEYVALGFVIPADGWTTVQANIDSETEPDVDIVWFELRNSAGRGEFIITDEDVRAVLEAAQKDVRIGGTDGMPLARVLWHSHYIHEVASSADVDNLPEWLDLGMVYHAPTGKTTTYNHSGVVLSSNADATSALATG